MKKELCVGTLEAARMAAELNIDRIETCIGLEQGGLTPTEAMVNWISQTFDLEQHVLIRLRAGGFIYSYDEVFVMREQIARLESLSISGFVIGALTKSNEIDLETVEIWKRTAKAKQLTFHRAFDEISDWKKAIDQLVKLGFVRILTSPKVGGIERIKELHNYSKGRIEIMPAGGVRADMIPYFKEIGLASFHFSASEEVVKDVDSVFSSKLLYPSIEKIKSFF